MADLKPGFDLVHTVTDYYDGPLEGIADYHGKPHFYDRIFNANEDEYSDIFWLTPIDDRTFALAMEEWAIWRRWQDAFHAGKVSIETHPALPPESLRHAELTSILKNGLVTDMTSAFKQMGRFEPLGAVDLPKGVLRPLQVLWTAP